MTFYILFLLYQILIAFLSLIVKKTKIIRILFLSLMLIPFVVMASFKSINVGLDTVVYYNRFINSTSLEFNTELLFSLSNWIIRKITSNFNIFLLIMYTIASIALLLFCYYSTEEPCLQLMLIMNLGYFNLSMSGLRQGISIPFFCLSIIVFSKFKKAKKLFFIIPALLSIGFHTSSALAYFFVLPYFLIKNKNSYIKAFLFTMVLCLLSPFIYLFIYIVFSNYVPDVYSYFPDASNTIKTLILYILINIYFIFLCDDKILSKIKSKCVFLKEKIFNENNFDNKNEKYSYLGFLLPMILICSIGESAIVLSRLIVTYLPCFLMYLILLNSKMPKNIRKINCLLLVMGSSIYFIFVVCIDGGLGLVPFTL